MRLKKPYDPNIRKRDPNEIRADPLKPHAFVPGITLLLSHLQAGWSPADIARHYGCASASVYAAVKRNGIDIRAFRAWKERKPDILSFVQSKAIEAAVKKIPKTGFRDLVTGFGVLQNAERLERGQSTANLSLATLTASLAELETIEADLLVKMKKQKPVLDGPVE